MTEPRALQPVRPGGVRGLVADWASDQRAFKGVSWGKAMMWVFLVSDSFVFGCFLVAYMTARASTTAPWPDASEVFALHVGGADMPLLLIAIMTFVLISSSGTMAMAVNAAYRRARRAAALLIGLTALLGAGFVGMQAFEWSKLIAEGVRPWGNPWGAEQFGATFFLITGFHGAHVSVGVLLLLVVGWKAWSGAFEANERAGPSAGSGGYEAVEIVGIYWHFVDLVWVFIFAFFYLW